MEIDDTNKDAQITVRIPQELRDKLEAFGPKLSKLVRKILEDFVTEYEPDE